MPLGALLALEENISSVSSHYVRHERAIGGIVPIALPDGRGSSPGRRSDTPLHCGPLPPSFLYLVLNG